MSDTIQSGPPDGEDDNGNRHDQTEMPPASVSDRPPTASALAAAFVDLEAKILRQLERNHAEQIAEIRAGQTSALKRYQADWSEHATRLEESISGLGNGFGRDVQELQGITHRTANIVDRHTLELDTLSRQVATFEARLTAEIAVRRSSFPPEISDPKDS
jgi:RNase adaptor protein for sRNA GlmZ degradation